MPSDGNPAKAGLEGVVAAQSAVSDVNGIEGRLIYRGYDIHDLAQNSTFEEVIYLLWNGRLPKRGELETVSRQLSSEASLPAPIIQLIKTIPKDANPMDMLRTVISALTFYDADSQNMSTDANDRKAIRLTAKFPIVITTFDRLRRGLEPVTPRSDLSIAANFLFTLRGEAPDDVATRTMDV